MLTLQAVTPNDKLVKIKPDTDVFVYGNAGANDIRVSSAALRADDAIAREDFWLQEAPEGFALFLVRAKDTERYEKTHAIQEAD